MMTALNKTWNQVKRTVKARMGISITAAIAILLLIFVVPGLVMSLNIKASALPKYEKPGLSQAGASIDKKAGEVMLAQSNGKKLYIDSSTLNLKVVDESTGEEWNSLHPGEDSSNAEKSPIIVKYLGEDGKMYEWDSYQFSIKNGLYKINKIENGAQIVLDFHETESYRLEEYMPSKIKIAKYEERFLKKIDADAASGKISKADAASFKSILQMSYQKNDKEGTYFLKFASLPPVSITKGLIKLAGAIGYTRDMLMEDSMECGVNITIVKPANFSVTMEATLDNGDLVVRVPTYEIKNNNTFYTIQNINVMPNFASVKADDVQEGYMFVPDGAGALFKLNTFNDKYPEYERPFYNNTYYDKLYDIPEYPEDLMMPVFGVYYTNKEGKKSGCMGIVEKGAELGHVKVQLGTEDTSNGGSVYNNIFTNFDSEQYSRVKVFGPYSTKEARFLSDTGSIDVDYTIRYKFFNGDVDYYDMAKEYKDYLMAKNNVKPEYSKDPKIFVDVIGALSLKDRFLGVPYEKNVSMTTYKELQDIVNDMQGINKVINYKGVFNNGYNNTINNKGNLVKVNGSKKDLTALMGLFDGKNNEMFMDAALMRVYDTNGGFSARTHALYGYDGKPISFRNYNYATGQFFEGSSSWYLLNPKYLTNTVDKFMSATKDYKNISVQDMGSLYYGNYNPRKIVNTVTSSQIVNENIDKLAKEKSLTLDNPIIDRSLKAKYSTRVSRESSEYGTMYSSVPFRQLVMNGLTNYTTLDVNMSYEDKNYFLMQAFELGSMPKFTICAENSDILKTSRYSDYFSVQYSRLKDNIKEFYDEYQKGISSIGTSEITNHEMLAKNVFRTTYASGKAVVVNYNKFAVTVDGYYLDAMQYKIIDKH